MNLLDDTISPLPKNVDIRDIISAQGDLACGIPVVLLDSDSISRGIRVADLVPASLRSRPEMRANPENFSAESYALQCLLGEHLLKFGGDGWTLDELNRVPQVTLNFHLVENDKLSTMAAQLRKLSALTRLLERGTCGVDFDEPRVTAAFFDGFKIAGLEGAALASNFDVHARFFPLPNATSVRLSESDIRSIASVHEIAFHTATHVSASDVVRDNSYHDEIEAVLEWLQMCAGAAIRTAAWRGGARAENDRANGTLWSLGISKLISNWSFEDLGRTF